MCRERLDRRMILSLRFVAMSPWGRKITLLLGFCVALPLFLLATGSLWADLFDFITAYPSNLPLLICFFIIGAAAYIVEERSDLPGKAKAVVLAALFIGGVAITVQLFRQNLP